MNKYKNQPTIIDGIRFASKREAKRYQELKLLERAGKIGMIILQPRYGLPVNGKLICTYVGDFCYFDYKKAETVTEDSKGVLTPEYKLKKKLMKAIHGIDIVEV